MDYIVIHLGITKPTIYDWIKHGKLKKLKIRSRVYFLGSDTRFSSLRLRAYFKINSDTISRIGLDGAPIFFSL